MGPLVVGALVVVLVALFLAALLGLERRVQASLAAAERRVAEVERDQGVLLDLLATAVTTAAIPLPEDDRLRLAVLRDRHERRMAGAGDAPPPAARRDATGRDAIGRG